MRCYAMPLCNHPALDLPVCVDCGACPFLISSASIISSPPHSPQPGSAPDSPTPLFRPPKRPLLTRVHRIRLLLAQPRRVRIELPLHLRGLLLEIRLPVQLALLRRGQGHGVLLPTRRGGAGLVGRGQGGGLGCQGARFGLGATLGFCGF